MTIQELYTIYLEHSTVCIDTRKVTPNCLFFALKGPNFNANEFALQALEQGAAFVVVDEEKYVLDQRFILVDDSLTTLQQLAQHHRQQLTCPVIGITGSNGKTTSKELCFEVLKQKFKTTATLGNLNNHIGVPLSLLSISLDTEMAIIEMGANHIGEIEFLSRLADPDYGVITNVGKAHLEGFGSLEGVLKTKTELYEYLKIKSGSIFVKDNQQLLLDKVPNNCPTVTYGQQKNSTYQIQSKGAQPFVKVVVENTEIQSQLIGQYNYDNIALSISLGKYFDISLENIKRAIENYSPTNNRSQIIKTDKNTILLDAYNANPSSVEKAIQNLTEINHTKKVMVLGDMYELGESSKTEHINIINQCINTGIEDIYLVGGIFNSVNATHFNSVKTTNELIDTLKINPIKDAFILIKGSRGMKLEQIVEHL
jgi:UDP-N-acetylmuramoyl-tripeptide--D-alanyl-D-alanine ligase